MADQEHNALRFLAKLQQVQDQYSGFFSASIRLFDSKAEERLTIESNGSPMCMSKRCESNSFCQSYCERVIKAPEPFQVYTCPYGQLIAIGRLTVPTQYLPSSDASPTYYLQIVDRKPAREGASDSTDPLGSLMNGADHQRRLDFVERAKVIYSAYSLAFDFAGNESGPESGNRVYQEQRAEILEGLTKREREVLRLVCTGLSNQQIADQLVITEHTVKLHIGNILKKTGLTNRTQLAILGLELL